MSCVELQTFTQLPLNYLYELSVLDLESRVRQSAAADTFDSTGPWELQYPSLGDGSLIQKSLLPLSATRRFLALMSPRHFLILKSSPEPRESPYQFAYKLHAQPRALIPPDSEDPGDEATDAVALTLLLSPPVRNGDNTASAGESELILVEVFAVGFTSGTLRVYSQDGQLLLEQLLHEEPVRRMRCFTTCHALGTNPRVPPSDQESLLLLYPSSVVLISGTALSTSCRGAMESEEGGRGDTGTGTGLEHRKWRLEDAREVNDVACLGVVVPSLFDHIQDACVLNGFEQRVRGVTAPEEQFLAAGVSPMFGFYSLNDQNSPNMSELVAEVATRVKSAISAKLTTAGGWLWSGSAHHEQAAIGVREEVKKKPPRILRPIGVPLSSNVSDPPRNIHSLVLAPRGLLAVATDNFGRVLLMDTRRKVVSRMWKGYRDAQCGWIQTRDEEQGREGLFLVMYAPKRGILEIWPSQSGSRVGAFTIGKDARLIHTPHGILGLGQLIQQQKRIGQVTGCYSSPLASSFVLHPSGLVREILVPFHLTLPPTQVDQAQDEVLLKMLRNSLQRPIHDISDTEKIILAIDSPIQVLSGLHVILRSCTGLPCSSVLQMISQLADKQKQKLSLKEGGENDSEEIRDKREKLVLILRHYTHLTHSVYLLLCPDSDPLDALDSVTAQVSKLQVSQSQTGVNSERLKLLFDADEEKLTHTLNMLQNYPVLNSGKGGRGNFKLVNFLSCFHIKEKISLKSSIPEEKRVRLGQLLFQSDTCSTEEKALLSLLEADVSVEDLLFLLLSYWFNGPEVTAASIGKFYDSLRVLTTSPIPPHLWEEYRVRCADTCMLGHALVAAMAGRLMGSSPLSPPQGEEAVPSDTWEPVSDEDQHWGRLVDQLQSLNSLFSVIGRLPTWSVPLSAREQSVSCRHYVTDRLSSYIHSVMTPVESLLGGEELLLETEVAKKLNLARKSFPLALSPDLLLAHSAVHAFSAWRREKEGDSIIRGVQCLLHLHSLPLRQGLALYCWEAYLQEQMDTLLQMVEKGGRCPSEKNLHKSLGMQLTIAKTFITQTKNLVEILQKTSKKLLTNPELLSEEEKRDEFPTEISLTLSSHPSAPCIVDTSISLKPTTPRACERLHLLLFCLEYIVSLDVRSVRPLSLITSRELLHEFKLRVGQEVRAYSEIQREREKFLSQIISHHTDPLHLKLDTRSLDTLYLLSELLDTDTELTRGHLSVSLYAANQDDRGEDILLTLSDKDVVCEDLVAVLGLRLGSLIFHKTSSQHSTYLLSQLPTLASKWVEGMWERRYESQLLVAPEQKQTLDSVKRLCETIKGVLSAQSKHKELISTLSTALEYLYILP